LSVSNDRRRKKIIGPYLKRSYAEDMVISAFDTPFRKKWMIVGIICFCIFPMVSPPFFLHLANLIAIACISAMALNLVVGTVGLLSLGHAGFMCAGAFTAGIISLHSDMPIWIGMIAAGLVGAFLGLIAGLPSFRLKGFYLGISTLAIHFIIYYIASEYQFHAGFGYGIEIEHPSTGIVALSNGKRWYFFLGFFVWLTGLFIANLLRTRPGRAWIAIRDRDIAARVMGIPVGRYKVLGFVVSTSITSIAGALYAYYTNLVTIEQYSFWLTISYFAMIIVGGMGSILGSILGAFLITITPYLLMYLFGHLGIPPSIMDYFYAIESGTFGLIIIFFLLIEPLGLVEIWRRVSTFFKLWPFRYKPLMITKR